MEQWITRSVATLVALGALGLFWTFGMFSAVPLQQGRLLALSGVEVQLIGVSLLAGLVTGWGALHLFALADRESSPRVFAGLRVVMLLAALSAAVVGAQWSQAHVTAPDASPMGVSKQIEATAK